MGDSSGKTKFDDESSELLKRLVAALEDFNPHPARFKQTNQAISDQFHYLACLIASKQADALCPVWSVAIDAYARLNPSGALTTVQYAVDDENTISGQRIHAAQKLIEWSQKPDLYKQMGHAVFFAALYSLGSKVHAPQKERHRNPDFYRFLDTRYVSICSALVKLSDEALLRDPASVIAVLRQIGADNKLPDATKDAAKGKIRKHAENRGASIIATVKAIQTLAGGPA